MDAEIPLFPLRSVLFPGGYLPLRLFEPRYLDMAQRCKAQGDATESQHVAQCQLHAMGVMPTVGAE